MSETYRIVAILEAEDKLTPTVKNIRNNAGILTAAFSSIGSAIGAVFGSSIATIAVNAVDTLSRIVQNSIGTFAGFEQTIQAAAMQAGSNFEDIKDTAYEVMEQFGLTSQEASQLALDLARAGISGNQLTEAMKNISAAAVATGEPIENLSKGIIAAVNVFGTSYAEAADLITQAGNMAVGTAGEFADALSKIAPLMQATNTSLKDGSAWLVTLNNAGISFAQAGMWINNVLRQWSTEQDKIAESFKQFGISIKDAEGNTKGIIEIMGELREKIKAGEIDINSVSQTLVESFGVGAQALIPLLKATEEQYQAFEDFRQGTLDVVSAQEQAGEMMENTAGAMERLRAAVEITKLELAEALAPVIIDLADILREFVAENRDEIVFFFSQFAELARSLLPVLSEVMNSISGFISFLKESFIGGYEAMQVASQEFAQLYEQDFLGIKTVIESFMQLFEQLSLTVQAGVNALMGVVNYLYELWMNDFMGIRSFTEATFSTITGVINAFVSFVVDSISAFLALIRGDWETAFNIINTSTENALNILKNTFDYVLPIIQDAWRNFWDTVSRIASDFMKAIYDAVTGWINNLKKAILDVFKNIWNNMKKGWENVYNNLVGGSIIPDLVKDSLAWFEKMDRGFQETMRNIAFNYPAIEPKIFYQITPAKAGPTTLNVNITIESLSVRDEYDIDEIAEFLSRKLWEEARNSGAI